MGEQAADEQPRGKPRRGCAVAAAVATGLFCGAFYWLFGVPFDGWSRMNETRFVNECEASGGTERFCECLLFQLKDAGVGRDEVDRDSGARAGFICGAQGEL